MNSKWHQLAAPVLAALAGAIAVGGTAQAETTRPNIVIVFTDDHGYADLGIHGADPDVRTPNLDQLAGEGVLFTRGYTTAPQCIPSRAGLMAGRHQNAFGLDDNLGGPLSHDEYTIAERLRDAGYVTGMVGKWHLEIGFNENNQPYSSRDHLPDRHGFEEIFAGYLGRYHATFDLAGTDLGPEPQVVIDPHYRIDIQTRAALAFLDRRTEDTRPFFLYLAYFAPHSPMEDPPQYMARMEHVEEYERRMALASILAVDDGVGLIREKLAAMGQTENTLFFFISDNGAPLRARAYIGSRNSPLVGEKGMQSDGGQRVPYLLAWPGTIPSQVFSEAVSTLDATATSLAVAGAPTDAKIEGVNLMPWLLKQQDGPVHDALYWRWRSQAAILSGQWKFIRLGDESRYLFDLRTVGQETAETNQIDQYPEIAERLENQLRAHADTWATPGLPDQVVTADRLFYDLHVDRTLPPPPLGTGPAGIYSPWDAKRPTTSPESIGSASKPTPSRNPAQPAKQAETRS